MSDKQKILVVDDEPVVISSAKKILTQEGFEVQTAFDAKSGLGMLRAELPNVLFLDFKLPELSGMELLPVVAREFPEVAVVMMTGYTTEENALTALQQGAFDFLPKPFTFEELLSAAHRALHFFAMSQRERQMALLSSPVGSCRLGVHSWEKTESDGSVQIGITRLFWETIRPIVALDLPPLQHELRQGGVLARFEGEEQMQHASWSPLSGRVIDSNSELVKNPLLLSRDPTQWLIRIIPANLETEIARLSH